MKLVSEEQKGKYVTRVHLFDLPLLCVKGKWTESMQEALMEQYGIQDPYAIEQEQAFNTLKLTNYDDQKVISEEKEIIDCYAMSGELYGCLLHEQRKSLTDKLIHERWNCIESNPEDIVRHAQLSNTIDIITQFYAQECQDTFQDSTPVQHQNISFRRVLLKTMAPKEQKKR